MCQCSIATKLVKHMSPGRKWMWPRRRPEQILVVSGIATAAIAMWFTAIGIPVTTESASSTAESTQLQPQLSAVLPLVLGCLTAYGAIRRRSDHLTRAAKTVGVWGTLVFSALFIFTIGIYFLVPGGLMVGAWVAIADSSDHAP